MNRHRELGLFLRSRRQQLSPDTVGIAPGNRRRVAGLRREEVAELAGISVDWYTRLEQGRVGLPSTETLNALARALRLPAAEHAHLRALLLPPPDVAASTERALESLKRLIALWQYPAYLVDERWDLLAWNDASIGIFGGFDPQSKSRGNLLRYMLLDEHARWVFGDSWSTEARRMVGKFRRIYDQHAGRDGFDRLIDDLIDTSPCFSDWWSLHDIVTQGSGQKCLRDRLGNLQAFSYVSLNPSDAPHLRLAMYMPAS